MREQNPELAGTRGAGKCFYPIFLPPFSCQIMKHIPLIGLTLTLHLVAAAQSLYANLQLPHKGSK